ncbi:MAG: creatininase family protein [Firmicutes bacterium]|nr:creatininase family protein [Bacillota bacterium]
MSDERWEIPPKSGHLDSPSGIYFQNMTMNEVAERLNRCDLLIIPIGSTEAHGPHACYGEDTFLVTRMAEAVAQRTGCTVSQPVWFGTHPYHHIGMPGTVPVDEDTFTAYLSSIIAGFWNAGFRKQILLNGHGQEYVIPTAIHRFARRFQVPSLIINLNWYYAIPQFVKDKAHGGPFETPFVHADECETSFSLALFPEYIKMKDAVDTQFHGFLPPGHVDSAANAYQRPIPWYAHAGAGTIEIAGNPEGVVGKATLASAEKAKPGVEALLDYMERLVNDIMKTFPPGKVPPASKVTQRFSQEEVDQFLKGPLNGGKHLYTIAWPPY